MTVTHLQEGPDSPGSYAHSASPGRRNGNPKPRKTPYWRGLLSVAALAAAALTYTQAVTQAADGDLDPTFGNGGKVLTGFRNPGFFGADVAIQADGRIIATGATQPNGLGFVLTRHLPDGSLDPSFVMAAIAVEGLRARDVAIQADGKIVVVADQQAGSLEDGRLLRFNTDGSLDTAFDSDGQVTVSAAGRFDGEAVAIQPDGKILVVGADRNRTPGPPEDRFSHFTVRRFNTDGSADPSFVVNAISEGPDEEFVASNVIFQTDGRIVVAGLRFRPDNAEFVVVRYQPDGSFDTSFDGDGIVFSDFGGTAQFPPTATVQSDGKIVVAGALSGNGPMGVFHLAVARYDVDGSLDAGFGSGGFILSNLGTGLGGVRTLALQSDGKILLAGGPDFILVRLDVNGSLDPTFGTDGVSRTPVGAPAGESTATEIAIQRDGRLVVIGRAGNDTAIVRYQVQPPAHTLTFFLHGRDIPGTVGGLTMNETAPPTQILIHVGRDPSWFSAPTLNGTLIAGSSIQVVLPCSFGLSLPKTIRLATTNPHGKDEQLLGQVTEGLRLCQTQTLTVPVTTPATLADRRLKLTIKSSGAIDLPLRLGSQTFLRVTNFAGTP